MSMDPTMDPAAMMAAALTPQAKTNTNVEEVFTAVGKAGPSLGLHTVHWSRLLTPHHVVCSRSIVHLSTCDLVLLGPYVCSALDLLRLFPGSVS